MGGSDQGASLEVLPSFSYIVGLLMFKLRVDEGEPSKVGLVDVGYNQLIGWCELGLGACEELVKVLCCFATL